MDQGDYCDEFIRLLKDCPWFHSGGKRADVFGCEMYNWREKVKQTLISYSKDSGEEIDIRMM